VSVFFILTANHKCGQFAICDFCRSGNSFWRNFFFGKIGINLRKPEKKVWESLVGRRKNKLRTYQEDEGYVVDNPAHVANIAAVDSRADDGRTTYNISHHIITSDNLRGLALPWIVSEMSEA
jgi:hypothetical protein